MQSVCVFCGSKAGRHVQYRQAAAALGRLLVERNTQVVYGGGQVGLMGVLADSVLETGGEIIGVIPTGLATKELLHPGATVMHVVDSMHDRKAKMAELADSFIALPGGFGTFEELFEVITWAQLGLHRKVIGVLNVSAYFDPLVALVENAVEHGFIEPELRKLFVVESSPSALLDAMAQHRLPKTRSWITPAET